MATKKPGQEGEKEKQTAALAVKPLRYWGIRLRLKAQNFKKPLLTISTTGDI